jgi:hypothetical protein
MQPLLSSVGRAVGAVLHAVRARGTPRAETLTVLGDPDSALLASAAALRRLGARITRYDVDEASLEARHRDSGVVVLIVARGAEADTSALEVHTGGTRARWLVRRLRDELRRPSGEVSA